MQSQYLYLSWPSYSVSVYLSWIVTPSQILCHSIKTYYLPSQSICRYYETVGIMGHPYLQRWKFSVWGSFIVLYLSRTIACKVEFAIYLILIWVFAFAKKMQQLKHDFRFLVYQLCKFAYRICSNIGTTLIQAPFETCAFFFGSNLIWSNFHGYKFERLAEDRWVKNITWSTQLVMMSE